MDREELRRHRKRKIQGGAMMCEHENRYRIICTEVLNEPHIDDDGNIVYPVKIRHDPVRKIGMYVCADCEEILPVLRLQGQLAAANARIAEMEKRCGKGPAVEVFRSTQEIIDGIKSGRLDDSIMSAAMTALSVLNERAEQAEAKEAETFNKLCQVRMTGEIAAKELPPGEYLLSVGKDYGFSLREYKPATNFVPEADHD